QVGPWRQVSNDFGERPALITSVRIRAAILAIDDSDRGWQVAAIDRWSWIAQTVCDDTNLHPFARHAKGRPYEIGTHHRIPCGRDTASTLHAVHRISNPAHRRHFGHILQDVRRHGRVDYAVLRIAAQYADTVLTQGIMRSRGQWRGVDIDFHSP